jgi:hypothetical protein
MRDMISNTISYKKTQIEKKKKKKTPNCNYAWLLDERLQQKRIKPQLITSFYHT